MLYSWLCYIAYMLYSLLCYIACMLYSTRQGVICIRCYIASYMATTKVPDGGANDTAPVAELESQAELLSHPRLPGPELVGFKRPGRDVVRLCEST